MVQMRMAAVLGKFCDVFSPEERMKAVEILCTAQEGLPISRKWGKSCMLLLPNVVVITEEGELNYAIKGIKDHAIVNPPVIRKCLDVKD